MKKIYALFLMLLVVFTLSACGPNSNYYKLDAKTYYFYENKPLVINPYNILLSTKDDNDLLKDIPNSIKANLSNFYNVKVEYRLKDSRQNYKSLELNENNMIYVENPADKNSALKSNGEYELKIHYIDKKTQSEKTMLNLYGVFTITPSNINSKFDQIKKGLNEEYILLNNLIGYDVYGSEYALSDYNKLYNISYKVTLNDNEVTVTDGKITLSSVGTYLVTIELVEKASGNSETDATSSASESGSVDNTVKLEIHYSIVVE